MLIKELKVLLEKLDDEKSITISICDYERVDSSSGVILELMDLGDQGYVLELESCVKCLW